MNQFQQTNKKLNNLRSTFFLVGLIIACSFTFLAFEWTTSDIKFHEPNPGDPVVIIEDYPPITYPTPPKPPEIIIEQAKINQNEIVIIDDFPDGAETIKKVAEEVLVYDPTPFKIKEKIIEKDIVHIGVEIMPSYIGGLSQLKKFLKDNIHYPEKAKIIRDEGKVYVGFVVGKNGRIRSIKILRGVSKFLDAEAIRVVKAMPAWKPGKQHGKPVSVQYSLPINFILK